MVERNSEESKSVLVENDSHLDQEMSEEFDDNESEYVPLERNLPQDLPPIS